MKKVFLTPILSLILFILPNDSFAGILLDRIVAIVGREVITWSDLYKNMEFEFSDEIKGLSPDERRRALKQYERDYLERLIDVKIQLNEAKKLNIEASKKEIDTTVERIRQKFGLDKEKFQEALRKEGFTFHEYRERIAEQIILSKLVNLEIRSKLMVTEKEIDSYIRKHTDDVDGSEGYRVRQIFIRGITPEEKVKAEERVEEIIKLLDKGESFENLAKKYSDGPNARQGGDLGFIKKDELAINFIEVLEGLERGQHSRPLWSDRGAHILYLEEKVSPDVSIRERAKEILKTEKFNNSLKGWSRSLRSKVFIEINL